MRYGPGLASHLAAAHNCTLATCTDEASEALQSAREHFEKENKDEYVATLETYKEDFNKTSIAPISGSGRGNRQGHPYFHCKYCKKEFATTVPAMVAHVEQHKADDYVIIGKIHDTMKDGDQTKAHPNAGHYQPLEHHKREGTHHFTTYCTVANVQTPEGVVVTDGKINCRKCKKYPVGFNRDMTLKMQMSQCKIMMKHENTCDGKGEVKNKTANAKAKLKPKSKAKAAPASKKRVLSTDKLVNEPLNKKQRSKSVTNTDEAPSSKTPKVIPIPKPEIARLKKRKKTPGDEETPGGKKKKK